MTNCEENLRLWSTFWCSYLGFVPGHFCLGAIIMLFEKPDIGTAKQDFETLNRTLTFIKHDDQF